VSSINIDLFKKNQQNSITLNVADEFCIFVRNPNLLFQAQNMETKLILESFRCLRHYIKTKMKPGFSQKELKIGIDSFCLTFGGFLVF